MTKKLGIILAAIFVSLALLTWLFMESSRPLPGKAELQPGRNHVPEGSKVDYKFNPPISGDHYPSWISKGFYTEPRMDGNVVHSMEHGYIIFWYDCEVKPAGLIPTAYAQTLNMTSGSEGTAAAKLSQMPKSFSDGSCTILENQIKEAIKQSGDHKLIAMPRVGMSSPLVLTAWGRAEKLTSVDQRKIKEFINAFRDAGPEATVEP